jgi:hypothetical protein
MDISFWSKLGIKTQVKQERIQFWDRIRKKYIYDSPEERVRQYLILWLHQEKQVPESLIAVEKKLVVFNRDKRFDLLVFNRKGKPILLVETKRPEEKLSQNTFIQISTYNQALRVPYLLIYNGKEMAAAFVDFESKQVERLEEIPGFHIMNSYPVQ